MSPRVLQTASTLWDARVRRVSCWRDFYFVARPAQRVGTMILYCVRIYYYVLSCRYGAVIRHARAPSSAPFFLPNKIWQFTVQRWRLSLLPIFLLICLNRSRLRTEEEYDNILLVPDNEVIFSSFSSRVFLLVAEFQIRSYYNNSKTEQIRYMERLIW